MPERLMTDEQPTSYCAASLDHPVHGPYHDAVHGRPTRDEAELFERLVMEINQAGLSWLTILKKRAGLQQAYDGFDVDTVAAYSEEDRQRLLNDPGIIRNKLKVNAAIHNAQQIQRLRAEYGSFANWLDAHHPRSKEAWVKLFRKHFKFVGGEIVGEFLMSTGYLPGAHEKGCPVYDEIIAMNPPWLNPPWIKRGDGA